MDLALSLLSSIIRFMFIENIVLPVFDDSLELDIDVVFVFPLLGVLGESLLVL